MSAEKSDNGNGNQEPTGAQEANPTIVAKDPFFMIRAESERIQSIENKAFLNELLQAQAQGKIQILSGLPPGVNNVAELIRQGSVVYSSQTGAIHQSGPQ